MQKHAHTLQVIETLNPVLAFYENVIGAAKRTKSKDGIISKPAVEVVEDDMQKLGYQFVARCQRDVDIASRAGRNQST